MGRWRRALCFTEGQAPHDLEAVSGDEYVETLQASAALGIIGGGVYDAMLANAPRTINRLLRKYRAASY